MFQDTKEGQTHYENDGCGEPAHNPMQSQEQDKGIRERFGKFFEKVWTADNMGADIRDEIADFFLNEMAAQRVELIRQVNHLSINITNEAGDEYLKKADIIQALSKGSKLEE
jgi:hypothetical protein